MCSDTEFWLISVIHTHSSGKRTEKEFYVSLHWDVNEIETRNKFHKTTLRDVQSARCGGKASPNTMHVA